MASPSSIVTMGYGNGTFTGSPSLVLTLGFGIGEAAALPTPSDGWKAEKRPVLWQAEKRPVIWKASNES